ncbi:MAG: DUF2169 domain-containing protein [Myxococcota bacterium]
MVAVGFECAEPLFGHAWTITDGGVGVAVVVGFRWHQGAVALVPAASARDFVPEALGTDALKGCADVWVRGVPSPTPSGRCHVGLALARGTEPLWAKCRVHSTIDGEPTWSDEQGPADGWVGGPDASRAPTDAAGTSGAPANQQLPYLRGGEQMLFRCGAEHGHIRFPASVPSVVTVGARPEVVPVVGETLVVDVERRMVAVVWRGQIRGAAPVPALRAAWLPTVAWEEVSGMPPAWRSSPVRPPEPVPPVIHRGSLGVAALPRGGGRFTLVAKAACDIFDDAVVPSENVPILSGEEPPLGAPARPSDLIPEKAGVDVLVCGHVVGTGEATTATARLRFGPIDTSVVAIGSRQWTDDGHPSPPGPVGRVPLTYAQALGSAENPVGMHSRAGPPPRLEDPERLVRHRDDTVKARSLGPVSLQTKFAGLEGVFDDAWRDANWPDLPPGVDRALFNAAPPDQRCDALVGDERFVVTGVRDDGAALEGALPGLTVFAFAAWGPMVAPVAMRLDTVLIDADASRLELTWRGQVVARSDQASPTGLWVQSVPRLTPEAHCAPAAWGALTMIRDRRFEEIPAPRHLTTEAIDAHLEAVARAQRRLRAPARPPRPSAPLVARADVEQWVARDALTGRDLRGADLRGLDLEGRDLRGSDLDGVQLDGVNLQRANLEGVSLIGARAVGADFGHADLSLSDLTEAHLGRARLVGAKLDRAVLDRADLTDADVSRASGRHMKAHETKLAGTQGRGASFTRADFTRADFNGARWEEADLSHAKLHEIEAHGVCLEGCALTGARLLGARFVDLRADGIQADASTWQRAVLETASVREANLVDAIFEATIVDGGLFDRSDLRRANLRQASAVEASFRRANLMQADLQEADLRRADFTEANLFDANLRTAATEDAMFDRALTR